MSHNEEIPMSAVIILLILMFIGLSYINYLCDPEESAPPTEVIDRSRF